MSLFKFALAGLIVIATNAAAEAPRLVLSITESIGQSDGEQCTLGKLPAMASPVSLTLTEWDAVAWHAEYGRWTLDPNRFPIDGAMPKLVDRCFILSINGKVIEAGVALSVNTPRMTGYPTLNVIPKDGDLVLQLTSGNHGRHIRLLHRQAMDAVLGNPASLPQWLARVHGPGEYTFAGNAWSNAVRRLIDQKVIRTGMPIADMVTHLGPPSSTRGTDDAKTYTWYFNTPMHVNPAFTVRAEGDVVSAWSLDRR